MRRVVADTGPLNYLVVTGDIELLPSIFDRVPEVVRDELAAAFERLEATSFYDRQGLLDDLLARHRKGNGE